MTSSPQDQAEGDVFEVRVGRMLRFANVGSLVRGAASVAWQDDGSLLWTDPAGDVRRWRPGGGEEVVVEIERLRSSLEPLYAPNAVPAGFDGLEVIAVDVEKRSLVLVVGGRSYRVDLLSYQVHPAGSKQLSKRPRLVRGAFPSGPEDALEAMSPSGRFLGADGGNLYVRAAESEDRFFLTADAAPDIEWSYRGDPWRPDSDVVAVVRSNFDGVARRPLTRWTAEEPKVAFAPRAEAGQPLPVRELFLLDTRTAGSRRLAVTDQDHNIRPLGWSADGGRYFFLQTRRDLRSIRLVAAEFGSGSPSTVLEETYQSLFSWADLDSLVTPVSGWQRFLWRSERDGWAHLYLYETSGSLMRQLTSVRPSAASGNVCAFTSSRSAWSSAWRFRHAM